jgi:hypothetical protein
MATVLITLGVGILGVLFTRELRRAYWTGFTLFGSSYLLAVYVLPENNPLLVTTHLLDSVEARIHPPIQMYELFSRSEKRVISEGSLDSIKAVSAELEKQRDSGQLNELDLSGLTVRLAETCSATEEAHYFFRQTGHALLAFILSCLGGLIALYLKTHDGREEARGT